jgi:hypothetical protein
MSGHACDGFGIEHTRVVLDSACKSATGFLQR